MKRALVVFGVLCLFLAAGIAIFIATFDADRYRPLVVGELQKSLGKPVTLQRLSLGWRGGIALRLQGLAVADDAAPGAEPLIQVESASAVVHLLPLLRKEVQVSSVVLDRPRLHLIRDASGRFNLMGLAVAGSPAAASVKPAAVGRTVVSLQIGSLRIEDGTLHWTDLASPRPPAEWWLKRLTVSVSHIALGRPMDLEMSGAIAGETPNVRLCGRVTPPGPSQAGSVENVTFALERVPLERLLPAARPDEPQLRGTLTVALEGRVETLEPSQAARAITGSGNLKLDEPVVANVNLLRAVFDRISILPGLMETFQARLPEGFRAKFEARDTVLSPVDVTMRVDDGTLQFDDLRLRSDTFEIEGEGRVGLDGAVNIRSTLRIEPALSAALIKSVSELQGITGADGRMAIPLAIRGNVPRVSVMPDLDYLASRLITTKVQDLLGSFLQKALEQHADPQTAPSQ